MHGLERVDLRTSVNKRGCWVGQIKDHGNSLREDCEALQQCGSHFPMTLSQATFSTVGTKGEAPSFTSSHMRQNSRCARNSHQPYLLCAVLLKSPLSLSGRCASSLWKVEGCDIKPHNPTHRVSWAFWIGSNRLMVENHWELKSLLNWCSWCWCCFAPHFL